MKEDKCNDKYCVLDKNHKGEHKWSSATWHQAVSDKETSGWEVRKMRKKGWSYQKIGKKMGVTRQRIHQILKYNSFKKEK